MEFVRNPETKEQVKELFDNQLKDAEFSKKTITKNVDYDSEFLLSQIISQIEIQGKKKDTNQFRAGFYFKIFHSSLLISKFCH